MKKIIGKKLRMVTEEQATGICGKFYSSNRPVCSVCGSKSIEVFEDGTNKCRDCGNEF